MGADDRLQRWWDGLNEADRQDAMKMLKSGKLSDRAARSLERFGVMAAGRTGTTLPGEVKAFLKTRH